MTTAHTQCINWNLKLKFEFKWNWNYLENNFIGNEIEIEMKIDVKLENGNGSECSAYGITHIVCGH